MARRLCRKHYQAAWAAGELDSYEKQAPRQRRRTQCPVDHKHADSSTCYIQHQCRCDLCCEAHNARERQRTKLKAYGRFDTGLVDAGPAREHLLMLGEFGMGYKRVAMVAGLGVTVVRQLIWGRQEPGARNGEIPKRVKRETAQKILAVRPSVEHLAGGAPIPARGTHRRVQALTARGWSVSSIGARIGWSAANFHKMMKSEQVSATTFRAVRDLYDELWDADPPESTQRERISASRARKYAADRGWVPPMAWDDIDTDPEPASQEEPDVLIDEQAIELAISGVQVNLSIEERRVVVKRLHGERFSDRSIARHAGITDRTVLRIRQELGLPGWSKEEQAAGTADSRQARRAAA